MYTIRYSQTWDNGLANVAGEYTFLTWFVGMRSLCFKLAFWQIIKLRDQIFDVKLEKEEILRRRAGDGDDYSV